MNNPPRDASSHDNVLQFRKSERFQVFRAEILPSGDCVEKEQLGLAFLKLGARMFRLKLWMFPEAQYFILSNEDRSSYRVLCPNRPPGKGKAHWNEVGFGKISGSFIRIKLHLLNQEILVCLFPKKANSKANDDAA